MKYLINLDEHRILENAGDRVPLGLLSIAANCEDTKVYDLNHTHPVRLFSDMYRDNPSRVGISVYTSPLAREAIELARQVKEFNPEIEVIAGGYHATAAPESLAVPWIDHILRGEADEAFGEDLTSRIVNCLPPSLDRLKNPDRNQLDMSKYGVDQSGKRTATLISSRGCPYHCSFCGKLSDYIRFEPTDKMFEQIDEVKAEGFEAIYFVDDVYTMDKDRMREIGEHLKEVDMPYRVTTRANLADPKRLDVLANTGCEWLSLGIESGDNEILKRSNKQMQWIDNQIAVKNAYERGINTKGFFIIGLPGETERTARRTIDFSLSLRDMGLTTADFYYLVPFPGTPIWRDPESFGIEIIDDDYNNYLQVGKGAKCVVNTEELKASRIEELVKEAKTAWN